VIETIHQPGVLRSAIARLDQAAVLAAIGATPLDRGPADGAVRLAASLADANRPLLSGPFSAAVNLTWQSRRPGSVSEHTLRARMTGTLGQDGAIAEAAITDDADTVAARLLKAA